MNLRYLGAAMIFAGLGWRAFRWAFSTSVELEREGDLPPLSAIDVTCPHCGARFPVGALKDGQCPGCGKPMEK